ncbi:hypothetical protein [Embleya sp. NBC_00896]|uniref:hypothetical protein n=1 Tax=Embleya sp. NBC_00896 TaxID=2975961 RepID=UPI002F909800|nr:hypothetical protein OG928_45345 [Embleya sp. NBC_00896]
MASVLEAFARPRPPIEEVEAVGDPIEVLPCAFHALRHGQSTASPDEPLHERGTGRGFVPTVAPRPGEQVRIDTTRLDVLALFEDGTVGRPELTIAVDVATRAILAAVLCPGGTKAVDAALLLAEMAVPHPARPRWPDVLRFAHTRLLSRDRLMTLDERLEGAAARPAVVPETIVVDRGKVFLSGAFTGACETLGISVQPAPPFAPTAKGIVEHAFGSINSLFCQHLPGYTGSDVTRRGPDAEHEACFSVAQLQDLLDEWLVHWRHRPHEGLRHPVMPKVALTPNRMWAALVAVTGYVPVPLSRGDYLGLLPVRWQAAGERGIRIDHRPYDHEVLGPYRGQSCGIVARDGKWEVHHNPHDARQIWIRLPDGELTEVPWIHRDHAHHPFNDRTWQYVIAVTALRSDRDRYEADLADALDQLMRRAQSGHVTRVEHALPARSTPARTPPPARSAHEGREQDLGDMLLGPGEDSLDELDDGCDESPLPGSDSGEDDPDSLAPPYRGLGLYDAHEEALKW